MPTLPKISNFHCPKGTRSFPVSSFKNKIGYAFIKLLILFIIYSLFTIHYSLAQSSTPSSALDKAQQDYTYQVTKYSEAHDQYLNAKSRYLAYKTAIARNNAYAATKDYLTQVTNLYVAYFFLIKETSSNINWEQAARNREKTIKSLDAEVLYLKDYQKTISNTQTLEELPKVASDLKDHIQTIAEPIAYYALATYAQANSESAQTDFTKLSKELAAFASSQATEEKEPFNQNWLFEIEKLRQESASVITRAQNILDQTQEGKISRGQFNLIEDTLKKHHDELKRSKVLFLELLKQYEK